MYDFQTKEEYGDTWQIMEKKLPPLITSYAITYTLAKANDLIDFNKCQNIFHSKRP